MERLLDESFDPRNVVMTAEPVDLPARPLVPAHAAEIVSYQNTQVVIRARAVQRGLLLLGDRFYPGWKAYVDGRPVPILRVNLLFRGVVLPPGEHEIAFRFAPASLRRGGWISLASIVCLLLVVGVAGWKVGRLKVNFQPATF